MQSRADLHVHSKYSDRPSEWFLRRVGAPESFMEPIEVYRRARARGMDFVTISDHNKIHGALDIAHLPNTFISCELTTYFPEDGAKLHYLVTGITEAQFKVLNELRTNIYDLRRYIIDNDIISSVAHPLFRVNDKLSPDHIEKLLVMFNRFEGINGTRDARAADLVSVIFRNLTPELIAKLADKHNLTPLGPTPWHKTFTGGSDDHGGVYIASAYTMTPFAENVRQYLQHVREGNHEMGGSSGNSLMLAHSFYHIAYAYYKARFTSGSKAKVDLLGEMLKRLLEKPTPSPSEGEGRGEGPTAKPRGLRARAWSFAERFTRNRRMKQLNDTERLLVTEFGKLFDDPSNKPDELAETPHIPDSRSAFTASCRISHQLSWSFIERFVRHVRAGDLVESLQSVASLGPVALSIAPYLASFATQHKDEKFMQELAGRFERTHNMVMRSERVAWITDAFADGSAMGRRIERALRQAADSTSGGGQRLTLVTCAESQPVTSGGVTELDTMNFPPVGRFTLQSNQPALAFPPFLEVIAYLEQQRFGELVIATPGPMGLTAMAAASLLGMRSTLLYHDDLADQIGHATEDPNMQTLAHRYLAWMCDRAERILVTTAEQRAKLIDAGLSPDKVTLQVAIIECPEHAEA
ncbi:MAG: glycosyltransferase [Phycisphaerales bacterium]